MATHDTSEPANTGRKTILIVDDDASFLSVLKKILVKDGYDVVDAPGGRAAQSLLILGGINLVISDIHMPEGGGIDLLRYVKRSHVLVPVVLMTGFAEISETSEAHMMGADYFLAKPFKREELLQTIKKCFGEITGASEVHVTRKSQDDDYCRIPFDEFVSGRKIKYDIFIRLSEFKYVKIAHNGEDISRDKIDSYKSKNINYLYLRKEDFTKYVGFNVVLAERVAASALPKEKKLSFLKHSSEILIQHIFINQLDAPTFDAARTVVETTLKTLTEQDALMDLVAVLNGHADHVYAHSLAVSLYSVLIAKQCKWSSDTSIFKISMCGLLHDIGKKEIDRSVLDRPRNLLSADEIKIYETHPLRGARILQSMQFMPDDIIEVALQHHENCEGTGFPSGLKKNKIHPIARLVAVADEFCNLAIKNPNSPGINPLEAVEKTIVLCGSRLDGFFVDALARLFKVHPAPSAG